ncbi:GTPase-activating protein for-like protein [Thermochaetoides thermophila DSM 1495]|uniref:GTPase-activating protein for-like protein n=1 Tax=Chaetomium thermophilum (strain DSM 1495 / CBS 144.50 / IMI 039719) TaxID=759272 RepID=G0S5U0_CHATD|nr:GTPase-activating protein for-like protein [Thermochaetoides thermophila DSM 1495]EGS21502.1 GTPase-activating protein for-like protein [Thermochaetoides thermophila DSM 1495]
MDEYLDNTMEAEETYICKGCGEILEEGKAFELAGNRWHLDCFRCNSCRTLLDSDANLLLLGDGSLICNNCTYSCSACGNKIEDLAILTGDQAYCEPCFRCRNCKRKIENLRYARTSHGNLCMSCHESLMARRQKKLKAAQAKREKEASPLLTDKSLPALPPNAVPPSGYAKDHLLSDSDRPTELSPPPRAAYGRTDATPRSGSRPDRSPDRTHEAHNDSSLAPSTSNYRHNRNSAIFAIDQSNGDSEGYYIPVALDPNPAPSITPTAQSMSEAFAESSKRNRDRDYYSAQKLSPAPERRADAPVTTPHIAFQEKGRQPTQDFEAPRHDKPQRRLSKRGGNPNAPSDDKKTAVSKTQYSDDFKLQEAPMGKKPADSTPTKAPAPPPHGPADKIPPPRPSQDRWKDERSEPSQSRPGLPESKLSDTYMQPRPAPQPPTQAASKEGAVYASDSSEPKLPRWSSGGDLNLEEDMARILGTDESSSSILRRVSNAVRHGRANSDASNHVRLGHSRSVSETTRGTSSPRWPKTPMAEDPMNASQVPDVTSPISLSGSAQDDPAFLKRQLRNSEQRVAELERQFNSEKDLKNLTRKVNEKRKTVSDLNAQTEIMIRQLEVLAGYVERAKKTGEPLDPRELEESAIKEFVQKLEDVKQKFQISIEKLIRERDELIEQRDQAIAERDRALMEFEQLSSKNAQLADMNNDLTHQIQERIKQQANSANGLGIYGHAKGVSTASVNVDSAGLQTGSTFIGADGEEVVEGATAVNVRKGQAKKFNWKKGSSKVAQNISKGINRAAGAFQQQDQNRSQTHPQLNNDNIGLPYNMTVAQVDSPVTTAPPPPNRSNDSGRQGFGFFSKKQNVPKSTSTNNVTPNEKLAPPPVVAEAPSTLFGSDLVERADWEKRQIPSVVTRCIEEVELRGMDVEGIYRKTGGNSLVKMIQEGFDKSLDFDISDPSLDITAVTSVLKQYFRKLPNPLLTFDVYDRVLESNSIQDEAERCAHLRETINMLPQKHRDTLEFLMFHLARVASRENENLMSPKNLAVVFAPTIMRDHSLEREMTDMHAKNLAVQFLIEHSHIIFGEA